MNKDKTNKSPYYTDKTVREEIDKLLKANSAIWSNINTNSPIDCGTRKAGEKAWKALANKIKKLDESFYNIVCPHGIDS